MMKKVLDVVFWLAIVLLVSVWVTDFIMVKSNLSPAFCLSSVVHEYKDGNVKECIGFGYRIYQYDRTSVEIKNEFQPFFIKLKK